MMPPNTAPNGGRPSRSLGVRRLCLAEGNRMTTKQTITLSVISLALLGAARVHQDNAESAEIISQLPPSTVTIHARRLPDKDITSITNLPKLQNLQFSRGFAGFPARITDAGLERLASLNPRSLRFVDLGFCGNITDAGLVHIARMDQLTGVAVNCPRITDAGLTTLVGMTNLTLIDLKGLPQITEKSLDVLAAKTNWAQIRLDGCPNITPDAVARLQAKLPGTEVRKDDIGWNQVYGRYLK